MSIDNTTFMWNLSRDLKVYKPREFNLTQDGKDVKVIHDFGRDDIYYFVKILIDGVFDFSGFYHPKYHKIDQDMEVIVVTEINRNITIEQSHTMADVDHYLMLLRLSV